MAPCTVWMVPDPLRGPARPESGTGAKPVGASGEQSGRNVHRSPGAITGARRHCDRWTPVHVRGGERETADFRNRVRWRVSTLCQPVFGVAVLIAQTGARTSEVQACLIARRTVSYIRRSIAR